MNIFNIYYSMDGTGEKGGWDISYFYNCSSSRYVRSTFAIFSPIIHRFAKGFAKPNEKGLNNFLI